MLTAILSRRKSVFWQSILDIPYRVLIYAVSHIAMVGNQHNHTLYTLLLFTIFIDVSMLKIMISDVDKRYLVMISSEKRFAYIEKKC